MVFCVQAQVLLPSTAASGRLRTALARAVERPRWGDLTLVEGVADDGSPLVALEVRFTAAPDMHDAYASAVSTATGEAALAGTRIAKHACSHDEDPPGPCVILEKTVI